MPSPPGERIRSLLRRMDARLPRPGTVAVWAAIAIGTAARLQAALQHNPMKALWSDPGRHWEYARTPLLDSPMSAIDPLGYQAWLSMVAKVTVGDPVAIGLYAGLLSALTPWIWYRFLREALPRRDLALLGWAVLAVLPSWVGIYSYFMTETLLLPLLGAALWLTWRALRDGADGSLAWAALLWALASLTRAIALPLALACLLAAVAAHPRRPARGLLIAGIWAACLLPAACRSHRILNVWSPFGLPALNQVYAQSAAQTVEVELHRYGRAVGYRYGYASPATGEAPLEPLSRWRSSRSGTVRFAVDIDHGWRDWRRALRARRAPPARRLQLQGESLVTLLFGRSWPDCNQERVWDRLAVSLRWVWAPLLLAAMAGNLRHLARSRSLPLLPALTLGMWLLVAAVPASPLEGRYRKPLEGLLIANALWLASTRKRGVSPIQSRDGAPAMTKEVRPHADRCD